MEELLPQFYACGFLYDASTDEVLLQRNEGSTESTSGKWALFGAKSKYGETPAESFQRAVTEAIGLELAADEVHPLRKYPNVTLRTDRHVLYAIRKDTENALMPAEGAPFAWMPLSALGTHDLTEMTKADLEFFITNGKNERL